MVNMIQWLIEYDKDNYSRRTQDWFLVPSIWPAVIISSLYIILIQVGKRIMKDRKPFELKNVLIVYNFSLVIASSYMVYEFLMGGWLYEYGLGCVPTDTTDSPTAIRMANVCYMFYLSKFVELLDTVFFVMRKKNNQITFLHLFHHGMMPILMWFGIRWTPGGHCTLLCLINSAVHVVMYFYYGVSAMGPQYQKYLWWKKYITKMQLTQFFLIIVHTTQFVFIECDFPRLFTVMIIIYALIFTALFSNFYIQSYRKKPVAKKAQ